ncbi:MAG: CHAT domain-containing protein [Chloroflexi bacterium]|nr:CHAT domain-containing protein [Chloroflexota bacterium]
MPITPEESQELQRRLAALIRPDTDLGTDLAAIEAAVERGTFDDLLSREQLDDWLELIDALLAAGQDADFALRFTLTLTAWALQRQVLRLLPDPSDTTALRAHASAWWTLASAFGQLPLLPQAVACYGQAVAAYRAAGDLGNAAGCLVNEATCLRELGRPAEALPLYHEAKPLLDEHGSRAAYARCLMNEAVCLQDLGRPAEALPLYREARPLLDEHGSRAAYAGCRMAEANCRLALGRPAEALPLYEQAGAECVKLGDMADDTLWRTLYNVAILWRDTGDLPRARQAVHEALPLVERLAGAATRLEDRLSLRETYADVYRLAIVLALHAGDTAAAFHHAQQAKGRLLVDLLEHRVQPQPSDRLAQELATIRWQEYEIIARSQLPGAPEQAADARMVQTLRQRRLALHAEQAEQQPERALLHGQVRSLAALRGCLGPGEAFLDLLETPWAIALFLVRGDQDDQERPAFAALLDSDALTALVEAAEHEFLQTLGIARKGWCQPIVAHERLRALLIGRLEEQGLLEGITHLILSPSGALHRVPFAALWRLVDGQPRYLYEDYGLSLCPTATSLWAIRQRPALTGQPTLLALAPFADRSARLAVGPGTAVAHPRTWTGRGADDLLPHTRREVEGVAAAFGQAVPGARPAVLVGLDATRRRMLDLAPVVRLVLAATHGDLAAEQGVLDFCLFFAQEDEDGRRDVRVREVYEGQLPLHNTFQVALTACHLGNVIRRGDEVLGFNQAFLSAGAVVSLAPLWAVDDPATADLSIAYHAALVSSTRPTVTAAWRQAMDQVRLQPGREHPYYWAAFLPAGDGAQRLP